jgi:hypothetical protein
VAVLIFSGSATAFPPLKFQQKTLEGRLLFGYFILSCRRKSDWLKGIRVKTRKDAGAR